MRSCPPIERPATIRLVGLLCILAFVMPSVPSAGQTLDLLVFTRTEGFTHPSIVDGVEMLTEMAAEEGATILVTDQTDVFTPEGLAAFDVAVFVSTTGDILDPDEESAFEGFIQAGGGWVGIHAAADCEYDWPWYGQLLGNGAWFRNHPPSQTATLEVEDPTHPGAGLYEPSIPLFEEWYNFQENPRPVVNVVMTLDETSYDPGVGAMGDDHPIAWAHEFDGGRAFYTGLGHRSQTYDDVRFQEQIRGAIRWAAGLYVFADGFESGDTGQWAVGR